MPGPFALAVLLFVLAISASPRHTPRAHPTASVQIEEAANMTLCEFEIVKDENEDRVPPVIRHLVCVPMERRRVKTCCSNHLHECVQLLDSIYVHVNGRDYRMQQRVGCLCMSTEHFSSRPMALPSPGR